MRDATQQRDMNMNMNMRKQEVTDAVREKLAGSRFNLPAKPALRPKMFAVPACGAYTALHAAGMVEAAESGVPR